MSKYYIYIYSAVILAAFGQIFLKMGTVKSFFGTMRFFSFLSAWTILGITSMVVSMLLSIQALSVLPLKELVSILPMVYILVPLLARLFLKESVPKRVFIGTTIIIIGIFIFNNPTNIVFQIDQ
jgi:drug/metabolite transporter (DMT)-like permease